MIVNEIKNFIKVQHKTSVDEILKKFDIEVELLQNILNKWQKKSKIKRQIICFGCLGCINKCEKYANNEVEFIEWLI